MKVNQNISAVISNANLHRVEDNLTASIERLSSGYKINQAKDSPAGIAISNKMRAQIEALDQSSRNAADGTSVIQTADGALNETTAMLQRMRELAVQAATDTMATSDRQACQDEIEQLQAEIDRIATDTEFNGKTLLDGSLDTRIYPSIDGELMGNCIRNFQTSDEVDPGNYSFTIEKLPEQATMDVKVAEETACTVSINGCSIEISETDSYEDIYTKLKEQGELAGVQVEAELDDNGDYTNSFTLTTFDYGSSATISYSVDDGEAETAKGEDAEISLIYSDNGFSTTATCQYDGTKVTIKDLNGFEIIFEIEPELDSKKMLEVGAIVDLEMTSMGSMTLQIGAHENQTVDVRIPAVTCEALYIDDLNVVRSGGADKAMAALDDAIAQVSSVRSRLGAYENRLDYAVASLDETEENMESAISRIMDTDMAEEMSVYANMNVLDQAAISVLTQANDMPQMILQLLN